MRSTAEKYRFIIDHPVYINEDYVQPEIIIDPIDVCPETERVEMYAPLNSKTQLWIEFIVPYYNEENNKWEKAHEWEMDCGGWTYDEAIHNLYVQVLKKHGEYTEEDSDKKYNEVHGSQGSFNSGLFNFKLPEERYSILEDLITPEVKAVYEEQIKTHLNTLKALHNFKESCTVQQLPEVLKHIQANEHEIWVYEESLKMGIDLDL